ncbi:hypothetical protein C7M61_002594 [Candidozyma pseudohaemuli]|uniref:Uncharacterized protein n=1 Tax=Candidozyma pseudohaemuli TaxID=418784 RepID=A0A2P7YRT4_9ASCO|nr:hypothetical protein C7M61_002594 [[Candida] pseudohaemulonii]PSK38659.1 hypothetical protein C7M61_002594 [[Candida] pseudohaemulonii]
MSSFRRMNKSIPSQVTKPVLAEIKGEKAIDKTRAEALLTKFISTSEAIASAIPGSGDAVEFSATGFSNFAGSNPKLGQLKRVQRELRGLPPLLAELETEYKEEPQNKKITFGDDGEPQNKKIKFDSEEPEETEQPEQPEDAEADAVAEGEEEAQELAEEEEEQEEEAAEPAEVETPVSKKRLREDDDEEEESSKKLKTEKLEKKEKKDKKEKKEKKDKKEKKEKKEKKKKSKDE